MTSWPGPAHPLPGVITTITFRLRGKEGRAVGNVGNVGPENGPGEWQAEPQLWAVFTPVEMQRLSSSRFLSFMG